ncbi:MAG: 50S ribosomal protein L15 [Candidatus Magnetoovum sp. WYHC-5]|nr:50S ribosomal protein L15 [Candidatus Magnetoovum sp. WYHC-5]
MKLNELKPKEGSVKRPKRVGRGPGSGHGKTACRGHKGQKARSGGGTSPGFEGGQMPLQRRLPKRGFKNYPFMKEYAIVNLEQLDKQLDKLDKIDTTEVITPEMLLDMGIIKKLLSGVKILGNGELSRPIKIKANAFSKSAVEKIEKAGGKVEYIGQGQ